MHIFVATQMLRRVVPTTLLFLLALLLAVGNAHAAQLSGRVVGVSDGDTLTLLTNEKRDIKVRLAGIDAPEKGQPFGQRSKENLSKLAFGKDVSVEWYKIDRYGRTVGKVSVQGKDANLEQVRAGLAWHYKEYAAEQSMEDRARYADAEESAKRSRAGLWSDKAPEAPWVYRHPEVLKQHSAAQSVSCSCAAKARCVGKRGGVYCINAQGNKRYEN
jgi:endonuclease YncB( thermonuclease family)